MLEIIERSSEGTCIVSLIGKLDGESAPIFQEWSDRRIDGVQKNIILDFSRLIYLSSAGLRSILTANRHAERTSTALTFCGLDGIVHDVFKMAGLLSYLPIYPGLVEALADQQTAST